jgi:hypothetical protein
LVRNWATSFNFGEIRHLGVKACRIVGGRRGEDDVGDVAGCDRAGGHLGLCDGFMHGPDGNPVDECTAGPDVAQRDGQHERAIWCFCPEALAGALLVGLCCAEESSGHPMTVVYADQGGDDVGEGQDVVCVPPAAGGVG